MELNNLLKVRRKVVQNLIKTKFICLWLESVLKDLKLWKSKVAPLYATCPFELAFPEYFCLNILNGILGRVPAHPWSLEHSFIIDLFSLQLADRDTHILLLTFEIVLTKYPQKQRSWGFYCFNGTLWLKTMLGGTDFFHLLFQFHYRSQPV